MLDTRPKKRCKFCNESRPNHFPYACSKNPKVINRRDIGMKRSRMKVMGKIAEKWAVTRAKWIANNPPDMNGYWQCYLGIHPRCPVYIQLNELTLDHVVSRSRDPSKRFEMDNLRPACGPCNELKGSRSVDQVKQPSVQ